MIKKYRPYIIFFYILAVSGLIIAAFYDLKLDIMLNNPENRFAIWFRNTGEIPGRLICPLAGAVLFYTCDKMIHKMIALIIELGGTAYLGYYIGRYFFVGQKLIFGIVFGLGIGVIILITGKYITGRRVHKETNCCVRNADIKITPDGLPGTSRVPNDKIYTLRLLAVFGIIIMVTQLLAIEEIKSLWGRVRFRDLISAGSYDAFTPWYHPNGINGNKSFPSGHTAGAGMSFLFMFIPYLSEKWEKRAGACFMIPFAYTVTVAYTRLVMGAHYLSDVVVGAVISFTIVLVALRIYETDNRQNFN